MMTTQMLDEKHERVLVLAPTGRDGPLACRTLCQAGLAAVLCSNLDELCREVGQGVGTLLLAEEALAPSATRCLVALLAEQPSWSDVPLVVVTNKGGGSYARRRALRTLEPLENVTFLERPVRVMTLVSTVRAALRARRRQYEVRDLLAQLERGMRQRDDFLAMLGHELRNPLAPIRNAVELLRMHGRLSAEQITWAAALVDRQSQQLTRLVDDLLEVSRITRGKIRLQPELVDLAVVIHQAIEASRPLLDARGHRFSVALPSAPLPVHADVTRLAQVVTNLLNNAAKYTDEGGQIWLAVVREGDQAVIKVRDTGIGIPADLLPHVFEPFTQGHCSPDRSQAGLGLGLAVVRQLVEMHGGSVQAFSEGPGRGSEFVVRLPLLAETPDRTGGASGQRPSPSQVAGRRVLVVDDDRDTADSLSKILKLAGHDVWVSYHGLAALEAARAFRPDVVLLDIGLPYLDGYEVARRLRREPGLANVLLVAMTGHGQEQDRRRAEEAGFDAHCIKPVNLDTLHALLARPS
ncbi:MAG TPA: ATP-binding protein [Gemmataceae bacterium]|jgi:signal transduction histidine kinase|nr:ATP-binding protein [Gemmataceae bacterium]